MDQKEAIEILERAEARLRYEAKCARCEGMVETAAVLETNARDVERVREWLSAYYGPLNI